MNEALRQTVSIVDDEEDVREAMAMLMRAAGLNAEVFVSARDFLQRVNQRDSGCLILDIRMPGMTGLELQAELHKRRIRLPIIFLTGHGDVPLAVRAMKAGAADFIQKPLDEHRLVMAVMKALKAGTDRGKQLESPRNCHDNQSEKLASLSRREQDVLQHLTSGMQNREIADALFISVKTVEFHRANIREKLGVANLPDLFKFIFGK